MQQLVSVHVLSSHKLSFISHLWKCPKAYDTRPKTSLPFFPPIRSDSPYDKVQFSTWGSVESFTYLQPLLHIVYDFCPDTVVLPGPLRPLLQRVGAECRPSSREPIPALCPNAQTGAGGHPFRIRQKRNTLSVFGCKRGTPICTCSPRLSGLLVGV